MQNKCKLPAKSPKTHKKPPSESITLKKEATRKVVYQNASNSYSLFGRIL